MSEPMSKAEREELAKLVRDATTQPWFTGVLDGGWQGIYAGDPDEPEVVGRVESEDHGEAQAVYDGNYIVAACEAVPRLLAQIDALEKEREVDRLAREAMEYAISIVGVNDGTDLRDRMAMWSHKLNLFRAKAATAKVAVGGEVER
jgi:hypothetical protein